MLITGSDLKSPYLVFLLKKLNINVLYLQSVSGGLRDSPAKTLSALLSSITAKSSVTTHNYHFPPIHKTPVGSVSQQQAVPGEQRGVILEEEPCCRLSCTSNMQDCRAG